MKESRGVVEQSFSATREIGRRLGVMEQSFSAMSLWSADA